MTPRGIGRVRPAALRRPLRVLGGERLARPHVCWPAGPGLPTRRPVSLATLVLALALVHVTWNLWAEQVDPGACGGTLM